MENDKRGTTLVDCLESEGIRRLIETDEKDVTSVDIAKVYAEIKKVDNDADARIKELELKEKELALKEEELSIKREDNAIRKEENCVKEKEIDCRTQTSALQVIGNIALTALAFFFARVMQKEDQDFQMKGFGYDNEQSRRVSNFMAEISRLTKF